MQTSDAGKISRMDVKLYTEVHLTYKAGFLTYRSLRCLAFSQMGMQWTHETEFPEYSDRTAQDSHLIPSSEAYAPALCTAILNYTPIEYYSYRVLSIGETKKGAYHCVTCYSNTRLFTQRNYLFAFSAASTTWPTSTEVVTLPTPPGTGVMASTMGSTFA